MMEKNGQTALILILLTAAALIFLAITLNWGRIAQTKVLVSTAADEASSLLASDVASYGEAQKETYLKDKNQLTESTGIFLDLLLFIIAIIVAVVTAFVAGPTSFFFFAALVSVAMSAANLVLQAVVVQPGITSLWNSLQKNQPVTEQFFEQGMSTALQAAVGDQVNVTDYFDSNANGAYGNDAHGFPNDVASRFALFYTDRLKMLNQTTIPQVVFFYDQLGELMNGVNCVQNENDYADYPGSITLNPACTKLNPSPTYCINNPIDPGCMEKIPNSFQLNDPCIGTNPTVLSTYSPYCDPCCQPNAPTTCTTGNCSNFNNPYGPAYPDLYDPTFQNYTAGLSFLDQFGRDQQMGPFTANMTPQGSPNNGIYFPNGIYPFFWLMDYYSPQVDNISLAAGLQQSQLHWCTASAAPGYTAPTPGFSDLTQLGQTPFTLPYSCAGQDCCVNSLGSSGDVIDVVGDPDFDPTNPAQDPSFGAGGTGTWLPGDNEMCSASPPYNGANANYPDGTCELNGPPSPSPALPTMTVDNLDDTLHTLSDFVKFSDTFLNNDAGTLSSTFQTWFPQVGQWINWCDDGSTCNNEQCGDSTVCGRLPPLITNLNKWNNVITTWLGYNYTGPGNTWCVPLQAVALAGNGSTREGDYIISNGGTWGSLPSVIACLNYNSNLLPSVGPVYNFQQCLNLLTPGSCPTTGVATTACDPTILGRSLAGPNPYSFNPATSCNPAVPDSYMTWVKNSLTQSMDQGPKFALRSLYLEDVFARANTMINIFGVGATALQNFLNVPAAQLAAAYNSYGVPCDDGSKCGVGGAGLCSDGTSCAASSTFPNSVIYGWVDNNYSNGQTGYAHIVKVTAYSVGRGSFSSSLLPWIQTTTKKGFFGLPVSRSYTLVSRDGQVYVSVKRWDEDHAAINFPNGHQLWTSLFHNPTTSVSTTGQGLPAVCAGVNPNSVLTTAVGFGLEPQTALGLNFANISTQDLQALGNAFMLNDNQGGSGLDPSAQHNGAYDNCLYEANQLLSKGAVESHACAAYVASSPSDPGSVVGRQSGFGDTDYSVQFYSCPEMGDDLTYGE